MHNEFTAVFERDGEWFIAYCPEIPGANGQGRSKQEARESLAAAISLILIPLGTALGFGSFSVFTATADSAIVFTAGWAIWLVVMQWASSFIGGYIAGRLRWVLQATSC